MSDDTKTGHFIALPVFDRDNLRCTCGQPWHHGYESNASVPVGPTKEGKQ